MALDPYRILGLADNVEPEVIEAAYKKLAQKYHPDYNTSANATATMQDINWAHEILKDPEKRANYDREASYQAPPEPKPAPPKPPTPQPKPKPPPKPKTPPPRPQTSTKAPKPTGLRLIGRIALVFAGVFAFLTLLSYATAAVESPPTVRPTAEIRATAIPATAQSPTAQPLSVGTVILNNPFSNTVSLMVTSGLD